MSDIHGLSKLCFLIAYSVNYQQTKSHAGAIRAGLKVLANRRPFDRLAASDTTRLVRALCRVGDPRDVTRLVARILRRKEVVLPSKGPLAELVGSPRAHGTARSHHAAGR